MSIPFLETPVPTEALPGNAFIVIPKGTRILIDDKYHPHHGQHVRLMEDLRVCTNSCPVVEIKPPDVV